MQFDFEVEDEPEMKDVYKSNPYAVAVIFAVAAAMTLWFAPMAQPSDDVDTQNEIVAEHSDISDAVKFLAGLSLTGVAVNAFRFGAVSEAVEDRKGKQRLMAQGFTPKIF